MGKIRRRRTIKETRIETRERRKRRIRREKERKRRKEIRKTLTDNFQTAVS